MTASQLLLNLPGPLLRVSCDCPSRNHHHHLSLIFLSLASVLFSFAIPFTMTFTCLSFHIQGHRPLLADFDPWATCPLSQSFNVIFSIYWSSATSLTSLTACKAGSIDLLLHCFRLTESRFSENRMEQCL